MSIIRRRIKLNPYPTTGITETTGMTGIVIPISLSSDDSFTGYQQEIDTLTSYTTTDLVNPVTDVEKRRFKHYTDAPLLQFHFYNTIGGFFTPSFINNGFTSAELTGQSVNVLNSFFILDFYDSFDVYNQTKIFTTYLTKIVSSTSIIPSYTISPVVNNQFYRWYVPVSYIDSFTGSTAIGYAKFSFYNAKTGQLVLFANFDNYGLNTPERLFFQTELNFVDKTWKIITPSYPTIRAKELPHIVNTQFVDRANDTFTNFDNLKQNYPSGTTFNYVDGSYFTT